MSVNVRSEPPTYAGEFEARVGRGRVDEVLPPVEVLCLDLVDAVLVEDCARTADMRSLA